MAPTSASSISHDPSCYNLHRHDHSSSSLDCEENELTLCQPNGSSSSADGDVEFFINDTRQYLEKYLGPKYSTTTETAILTVVYCLIFLTGVVGNVCTGLVVISRSYMRTSTNLYLCSLAISDILTLLFGLPTELYTVWEAYPWRFGQPYCLFKTFLTEMTSSASVLTIAAFTIERHVAICYPLLAHTMSVTRLSRATRIVSGVWIAAAVSAVPYPLYTRTYHYLKDPLTGRFLPDSLICNIPPDWVPQMRRIFQLSTFSMFVAPMLLISALYVHIGITVRRSLLLGRTHPPPPPSPPRPPPPPQQQNPSSLVHRESKTVKRFASFTSQSPRKSVIKMLVAVMVAFFVCWAPFHAQRLMTVYISEDQWTIGLIEIQSMLFYVSGILYYVSCTVNPILYNLLSHKYRRAFADVLCSECCSSSLFARWRKVSFTSEQMLQTEQQMERNRSYPNRRRERRPVLQQTGGVAVEVFLPETPSYYGSIQRQSIEMRILNRYSNDSKIFESKHRSDLLDSDRNVTEISTDRQELAESSCTKQVGMQRSFSNPASGPKHDENERGLIAYNVGNCRLCSDQSSQETCFGDKCQLVVRCKTGNDLKRNSETAKSYESCLINDSVERKIIASSDRPMM